MVGWTIMLALLCLLFIELINHSIDNETLSGELSYFLFATYIAMFLIATLACFSRIVLSRENAIVGLEPYYRTVICLEK